VGKYKVSAEQMPRRNIKSRKEIAGNDAEVKKISEINPFEVKLLIQGIKTPSGLDHEKKFNRRH